MPRIFLTVMLMFLANPVVGEEAEHPATHEYHRNSVAGFIGITDEGRREKALTLGVEYERRLSMDFGVVFSVERALGDLDFTVLTVPFAWHRGPWIFSAGPGIEFPDHEGDNEFLVRGSVLYTFDRGGYELAPKLAMDFVDGEVVLVVGLIVGYGF